MTEIMKEECWDEQTRRAVDHTTLSDNETLTTAVVMSPTLSPYIFYTFILYTFMLGTCFTLPQPTSMTRENGW